MHVLVFYPLLTMHVFDTEPLLINWVRSPTFTVVVQTCHDLNVTLITQDLWNWWFTSQKDEIRVALECCLFRRQMTSQPVTYFLLFLRYVTSPTNNLLFPFSVGMWHQKSITHFPSFGMWHQKLTIRLLSFTRCHCSHTNSITFDSNVRHALPAVL